MAESATIVVQFGEGVTLLEGHLSAELDTRPSGLNAGRTTTFNPGSNVYLLTYRTANVRIAETLSSAGTCSLHSTLTLSKTEDLFFKSGKTASLGKPLKTGETLTVEWFGPNLGTLTVKEDRMTIEAANSGVSIARVTYSTQAEAYALTSPTSINGRTVYPILVVIKGQPA